MWEVLFLSQKFEKNNEYVHEKVALYCKCSI